MIAPIYPAATTIVYRRADDAHPYNYRVLFIRRPNKIVMGGVYAYPGGRIGPEDQTPDLLARCRGLDEEARQFLDRAAGAVAENPGPAQLTSASSVAPLPDQPPVHALAPWFTAARELLEEVGILVACDRDGRPVDLSDPDRKAWLAEKRRELLDDKIRFADILTEADWYVPIDAFTYFYRLVTPTYQPKRFDTRFFFVELPAGQEPDPYTPEVEDFRWLSPVEVQRLNAQDILEPTEPLRLPIMAPTLFTVSIMSRQPDIDRFLHAVLHGSYKPKN